MCVPALNSSTTPTFECACKPGFAGPQCTTCEAGYYGPFCRRCAGKGLACGTCNDGITGTGACIGVQGNSTECGSGRAERKSTQADSTLAACTCQHGTCIGPNTCECSAGYTSDPADHLRCSRCAPAFYQDTAASNCLACPLGTLSCNSLEKALTCISGWAVDASGACKPSGGGSACADGQYWTGSSCSRCVPRCFPSNHPLTARPAAAPPPARPALARMPRTAFGVRAHERASTAHVTA